MAPGESEQAPKRSRHQAEDLRAQQTSKRAAECQRYRQQHSEESQKNRQSRRIAKGRYRIVAGIHE